MLLPPHHTTDTRVLIGGVAQMWEQLVTALPHRYGSMRGCQDEQSADFDYFKAHGTAFATDWTPAQSFTLTYKGRCKESALTELLVEA